MLSHVLPALFAVLAWWAGTALILHLDGLPRATFMRSMRQATLLVIAAMVGLVLASGSREPMAAYAAFGASLVLWGWLEMSFLLGFITGPRKDACDAGIRGWPRFRAALGTLLYHEIALAVGALLVLALTWQASNQVGLWTYLVLWIMRTSAKINVFLGVRNLSESFLPEHLRYLESYFRRAPMNLFFPVAVSLATIVMTLIFMGMPSAKTDPFGFTAAMLAGSLLFLAILEHWCMVIPFPVEALWSLGLRSRGHARPGGEHSASPRRNRPARRAAPPVVGAPLLLAEALKPDLSPSIPERSGS